ncbi:GNAT family N-acetyltransferase [Teredinibacter purpureus]|uniref:GNAT family N-acetyltransferase n=1 Tax=Teredinibacter purpureus TaxID=2731756 RepID=UPI0005F87102|nr:GNAT family N-acetyltransferase [Teredinibacter purpureus]
MELNDGKLESVSARNLADVLPLIRAYQEFYNTNVSDQNNEEFFSQFGESNSAGCQFLCRMSGQVVGFATVYFSFTSTIIRKVAVLNDLFVVPEHRGKGVGRALIEHCRAYAKENGAVRMQWLTAPDNISAQILYDSLNTNKVEWYCYTYKT